MATTESLPDRFVFSTVPDGGASLPLEATLERGRRHGFRSFACDPDRLPPDPGSLLRELREQRLRMNVGELGGPNPASPDAYPGRAWLASTDSRRRESAVSELRTQIETATSVGCRTVLVAPGPVEVPLAATRHTSFLEAVRRGEPLDTAERDSLLAVRREMEEPALDAACRSLHELCRAFPNVTVALRPGAALHVVPQLEHLGLILADVRARNLAYWHDPGRCLTLEALGLGTAHSWLEEHRDAMAGLDFCDARPGESHLLPGQGHVDFGMLGFYAGSATRVLVRPGSGWDDDALRHAVHSMSKCRLLEAGTTR